MPRPQTEPLARHAAGFLAGRTPRARAADLCTGNGALACVLQGAARRAAVVGTDCDPLAARTATENGVPTIRCDAGSALATRAFDLVVAVAPYVPTGALAFLPRDVLAHEPHSALDGGADGLAVVRRVVEDASRLLVEGGRLYLELGGEQDSLIDPQLRAEGLSPVTRMVDDDGDLRGVVVERAAR